MHIIGYLKGADSDQIPDLPDSLRSRADIRRDGKALYIVSSDRLNYITPENRDALNQFYKDVRDFAREQGYEGVKFDWENSPVMPTRGFVYEI